jgi:hypothetical protein
MNLFDDEMLFGDGVPSDGLDPQISDNNDKQLQRDCDTQSSSRKRSRATTHSHTSTEAPSFDGDVSFPLPLPSPVSQVTQAPLGSPVLPPGRRDRYRFISIRSASLHPISHCSSG